MPESWSNWCLESMKADITNKVKPQRMAVFKHDGNGLVLCDSVPNDCFCTVEETTRARDIMATDVNSLYQTGLSINGVKYVFTNCVEDEVVKTSKTLLLRKGKENMAILGFNEYMIIASGDETIAPATVVTTVEYAGMRILKQ